MDHTQLLVLTLLAAEEMYGYQIITELEKRSDHTFAMKEGTLYPVLHGLWKDGYPLYQNGAEVLEKLTAGQIAYFAGLWAEFDRECDPAPWDGEAVDRAKKAWSTRVMSAFNGACSVCSALCPPRRGRKT